MKLSCRTPAIGDQLLAKLNMTISIKNQGTKVEMFYLLKLSSDVRIFITPALHYSHLNIHFPPSPFDLQHI